MRSSDAFPSAALEKPWVALAPHKCACTRVQRRIGRALQIWQRQQARHVSVVHEYLSTEAIHLISPDPAFPCGRNRMLLKRSLHVIRQRRRILCQRAVAKNCAGHLRQLPQRSEREEVRRHQERKDARIVRRSEARSNQANRLDRISKSLFSESLCRSG